MPLPTGMCMECRGVEALGKPSIFAGGGGCCNIVGRGARRGSSAGRVRWKGVPALEEGF